MRAAAGATGAGDGCEDDAEGEGGLDEHADEAPPAADERYAPPAQLSDTPAFLAGRSTRPAPAPTAAAAAPAAAASPAAVPAWPDDEPGDTDDDLLEDGYAEPPYAEPAYEEPAARRPVAEPRRVPVGYAPVAPTKNDRRAGSSRRQPSDPGAPAGSSRGARRPTPR